MNQAGRNALRVAMPQTAGFLDELRAAMDSHIAGSSAGLNRGMVEALHGTPNRFHFVETGADGERYEVGTAYTPVAPDRTVHTREMQFGEMKAVKR